jgi:hypothetical protein
MPFKIQELLKARESLLQFQMNARSPYHQRYSFPFFAGTYFGYRKIDVLRVVAVAKSLAKDPTYIDVGCGYGDFLSKIREYIPKAIGIEKEAGIFYGCGIPKPDYITISDANWINEKYDVAFVGWMEPGEDFRNQVASFAKVIITTLDQGISLAAEFEGHGFSKVASWITPSWEDVNTEIMNRYYTHMSENTMQFLSKLRGAHNLWYVYAKPEFEDITRASLDKWLQNERNFKEYYDFEGIMDECGYGYMQVLEFGNGVRKPLWKITFH